VLGLSSLLWRLRWRASGDLRGVNVRCFVAQSLRLSKPYDRAPVSLTSVWLAFRVAA
jgi:hypothetical protein